MNEITQIQKKLEALSLEKLSQEHNYHQRASGKVSAYGLISGFFLWFTQGQSSLRQWAGQIGFCLNITLSKQGLASRLNDHTVNFCRALLQKALEQQLFRRLPSGLFQPFSAVYLEDSTCQGLPKVLSESFRGAYSKKLKKPVATFRVQLCFDLLRDSYRKIEIFSYSQNDQSYANKAVGFIQAGNLIIRDLGYWGIKVFREIEEKKAFFLSRLQPGVNIYDPRTGVLIDIAVLLRKAKANRQSQIDIRVRIGSEQQFDLRLIALLLPERVATERRRKAKVKEKGDKRIKRSKDYLSLLDWNILVTNVSNQQWTATQAFWAYQLRWRIEICFKSWKSSLNFKAMFENKQSLSEQRVYIMLYLTFLWLVLFLTPWLQFFLHTIEQAHQRFLSIIAFTRFARDHFLKLINTKELSDLIPHVMAEALHGRRKRISQVQWLFMLANGT